MTVELRLDASRKRGDRLSQSELLTRADLRGLGIRASNHTLLTWEADGKFPKRLTISPAKVAWLKREVEQWIEAKAAERFNANPA